jgi:predicted N-formylglutamate amidohydrolase
VDVQTFLGGIPAVSVRNETGSSQIILVCEHASNYVPDHLSNLGLPDAKLAEHIAWDPGAVEVAGILSDLLDAPLVHANVSRLVLDINRRPDHPGSIVTLSETTVIPGNEGLSAAERSIRCEAIYNPFHSRLEQVLATRQFSNPWVLSIHSYTPVYKGLNRPWHVGILHDADVRLSAQLIEALKRDRNLVVGDNQPYAPSDGVYHTVERHTKPFERLGAMIEIRNDLIADRAGQVDWAHRLHNILAGMRKT